MAGAGIHGAGAGDAGGSRKRGWGVQKARSQKLCCATLDNFILIHRRVQGCGMEDTHQGKYTSEL